ncbi:ADP-ribose pyrophosphatase YjhB (NUDIX family) [Tumebacillus sp. BK434]|uniref:NUDIX hydrolase n=1 Tax=Tumebacillus sp. BK434 TaxID=2512169 RepID=UPI001053134D|nr:NUDIX domain-containing protein [Tumebacillus sp. BK434]TCP54741.1 ADP-ribose pyrophosphatase YjhB (NUDIX family) [Tumebacillus sp. BK434]
MQRFTLIPAVHIFFVREGEVLLLRRANTGYEDGNYSVVAGHIDGKEEVRQAAIREAREEAGVEIVPEDVQVVGVMHRLSNDERVDFFVAVERWTGQIRNMEPDKCDDLRWFAWDDLPDNIIPYVRRALQNYRQGNWFDSVGFDREE